jgi:hypothetical protein
MSKDRDIREEKALFEGGLGRKAIAAAFEAVASPTAPIKAALDNIIEETFLQNYNLARVEEGLQVLRYTQPHVIRAVKGWLMEEFRRQFQARCDEYLAEVRKMKEATEKPAPREVGELRFLKIAALILIKKAAAGNLGEELELPEELAHFAKYGLQRR